MKPLTAVVLVILTVALLLHDVDARGGGGGPSGRGSIGSGSSKSRITKTTPIKPVRFRTPVIKSQGNAAHKPNYSPEQRLVIL